MITKQEIIEALGGEPLLAGSNSYENGYTLRNDIETSLHGGNLLFTIEARQELEKRLHDNFLPTEHFHDDFSFLETRKNQFLENPAADRYTDDTVTGGVGTISPVYAGKTRNIHLAALYSYIRKDEYVANVVANEFIPRLINNDLTQAPFSNPDINWDRENALFHFCTNVKKMYQTFELIGDLQTVWTVLDYQTINAWFKQFINLLWPWYLQLMEKILGDKWREGKIVIPNFRHDPQYLKTPIQDENGVPLKDNDGKILFSMTSFQESAFNNRLFDVVGFMHTWAVSNNAIEMENTFRQHFKLCIQLGTFHDGTYYEMIRNTTDDRTKGYFYTNVTLSHLVSMCHLDAMANHFPNDRLYDYSTTKGIKNGGEEFTKIPYNGASTTDGVTPKSLLSLIKAQSKYLRSTEDGGWNDVRFFEGVPINPRDRNEIDNLYPRNNSIIAGVANLYYKDEDIKKYYLYDETEGYPTKEGHILEGVSYSEDFGANEEFIIGNAWIGQEHNFFDQKYFANYNNTAYQAKIFPIENLKSTNVQDAIEELYLKIQNMG